MEDDISECSSLETVSKFDQLSFKSQLEQFAYKETNTPANKNQSIKNSDLPEMSRTSRSLSNMTSTPARIIRTRSANSSGESGYFPPRSRHSPAQKHSLDEDAETASISSIAKKKRTSTKERSFNDPYNPTNLLVDSLRPDLILVFIGLNPGLTTAATGHAYAHRSNRFWHLLHESGITTKRHLPSETYDLMDLYQIGNTNICARPTRSGDGLSKEEMIEGAMSLEKKIAAMKPEAVCIVGKSIWEAIWKNKTGRKLQTSDFKWGWQDEEMWLGKTIDKAGVVTYKGSKTFVATSTSGLAATLRPAEKLAIWKPLGDWFSQRRQELESRKT